MSTPHVMLVVKGLGQGGTEQLVLDIVRRTVDDGLRCTVAYVRADVTHHVDALLSAGAEVVAVGGHRVPWPLVLARLIRRQRPDVVHSHSPFPAAVARLAARTCHDPSVAHVTTEHSQWVHYRWPVRLLNALTMPLDDQVWAVSADARASVRPGWLRRRVGVLHHGVDVAAVTAAVAAGPTGPVPEVPADAVVVVHVANRRPAKAHDVLLAAADTALAKCPRLVLWLVGKDVDAPDLQREVAASPAGDRIVLLGPRSDAVALMARADLFVLSSDTEGLPVAVMESLVVGTPIVSTAVGGVPEAARDGREGWLVPIRDPDALALALVEAADDDEERARRAAAAAERGAWFDGRRALDEVIATYRSAAGRSRRGGDRPT